MNPPVWTTKEGQYIPITKMLDSHILHSLGHLESFAKRYNPDDWDKYLPEIYFYLVGEGVYRDITECNERAISLKIECLYDLLESNAKKRSEKVCFKSGPKMDYRCATCSKYFDYHNQEISKNVAIKLYKLCPECTRRRNDGISDRIERSSSAAIIHIRESYDEGDE